MKKNALNLVVAIALFGMVLSADAGYIYTGLSSTGNAYAINNSGQVVGFTYMPTATATVWNGAIPSNLDTLQGNSSMAYAINNSGQVAGVSGGYLYSNGGGYPHATFWSGTGASITDLGTLGGHTSMAYAINDSGVVAGYSIVAGNTANHATLWNGSVMIDLGTLGGTHSYAYGINNSGQVVGAADIEGWNPRFGNSRATIWNGTVATDLGTLGGATSVATAINNSGQVVGHSDISDNSAQHATLWNGTTATDLGTLGGTNSFATAINSSGQVVGYSEISNGINHAFLWNGTALIDLNSFLDASMVSAGWVLRVARGINDSGSIVGHAENTTLGIGEAFLMSVTPVPEADTSAMLLIGLGVVGFMVRRRRNTQA